MERRYIFLSGVILYCMVFLWSRALAKEQQSAQTPEPVKAASQATPTSDKMLNVGPITLSVTVTLAQKEILLSTPNPKRVADQLNGKASTEGKPNAYTLRAGVLPQDNVRVTVQGTPEDLNALTALSNLTDVISKMSDDLKGLMTPALVPQYDFDVSLDPKVKRALGKACLDVNVYRTDGTSFSLSGVAIRNKTQSDLAGHPVCDLVDSDNHRWHLDHNDVPIALLQIEGKPNEYNADNSDCSYLAENNDIKADVFLESTCQDQFVMARSQKENNVLIVGMEVKGNPRSPILSIRQELADDTASTYFVNDKVLEPGQLAIPPHNGMWSIDWQSRSDGCRIASGDHATLAVKPHVPVALQTQVANGIVVGGAKIFDVLSLQRMLNATAGQLAAISGFNATPINAAFGNFQGITRDTSYFNAQLTTAPTQGINQVSTTGVNTPNTTQTTTPIGSTVVTLQCPDGSLPTIGTSNTLGGCTTVPVTGTTANVPAYAPVSNGNTYQGVLTTTPAGSTVVNTGSTNSTQNQTTTTIPTVSGVVPNALSVSPLTAPGNVGVASADILAEQVQLNSQITTMRLLLQGALSDQYLLKNSTAVGQRQQTTLGFTVALDPPRQFKHAVAEIRVILIPTGQWEGPSIMNLLPSEKTYNVAKVTSSQKAFGAGAVLEPLSLGVNTGKSKDRLYLAKDTDTLALEFPLPLTSAHQDGVADPLPEKVEDLMKSIVEFQTLGGCSWGKASAVQVQMEQQVTQAMVYGKKPIAFGWQFRPVLGADYVQGGERQVFAQLALGAPLDTPDVYVETFWREYDPKNQVLGAAYKNSCSLSQPVNEVVVLTEPKVRDVSVSDLGSGQLKLTATGSFYTTSLAVLSGQTTLPSMFFDGSTMEVFGAARDLLQGGDLKMVGQSGQNAPFGIPTDPKQNPAWCGISKAAMRATPRSDGNSHVDLDLTLGPGFNTAVEKDGELHPLVMVGAQIYGLRESPFINDSNNRCSSGHIPSTCHYEFVAPTTSLRNSQTFFARDLAWPKMQITGTTQFLPSFVAATALVAVVGSGTAATAVVTAAGSGAVGAAVGTAAGSGAAGTAVGTAARKGAVGTAVGTAARKGAVGTAVGTAVGGDAKTTSYQISGYDFTKLEKTCRCPATGCADDPCIRINTDLDPDLDSPIPDDNLTVVNDNVAIVKHVPAAAKALRFQIYWKVTDKDEPDPKSTTEWDVTLKASEENKSPVIGSPAFVYVGDSRNISFSSKAFVNCQKPAVTVKFNGGTIDGTCDSNKKSLNVPITTAITSTPGHKELTLTISPAGGGAGQDTTLSFDVVPLLPVVREIGKAQP